MNFPITSMRRIFIRSWHDAVFYILLVGLFVLANFLFKKLFPKMSEKAVDIISGVIIVIVGIIGFFMITPLTEK